MADDSEAWQKATSTIVAMLEKRLDGLSGDIKDLTRKVDTSLTEATETRGKVNGLITLRNWAAGLLIPLLAAAVINFFLSISANTKAIDRVERSIPAPPASTIEQLHKK